MLINRIKQSKNIVYLLVGAGLILMLFASIFISGGSSGKKDDSEPRLIKEVTIENDQGKLKIKRNGVVEVTSGKRVFYQFWDKKRVNKLFSLLNQADFSSFGSRLKPGETGYLLTLTTGNGTVTIAVPDSSESIPAIIEELVNNLEELIITLGESNSPNTSTTDNFSSPTATVPPSASVAPTVVPSPLPTATTTITSPSPGQGGEIGSISPLAPFKCELTDLTTNVNILSETICNLIQ